MMGGRNYVRAGIRVVEKSWGGTNGGAFFSLRPSLVNFGHLDILSGRG